MGNTQSAEAPRRPPTKLTKPRTNTSTSNLLATSSAPSRRSSTLSLPVARNKPLNAASVVDAPADGDDSAVESKTGSRAQRRSLFRSKSVQPESTTPIDEDLSGLDTKTNSNPLHRYSSMVSIKVDVTDDTRISGSNSRSQARPIRNAQTYFPRASQPARLSLVIEAQSPTPDPQEELRQLGLRHGSVDNGAQNSPISPIERSTSPESIPIPIRRRSLLTPGIATRKPSREKIVRKSLPAQPSFSASGSIESRSADEKRNFRKTLPAQPTTSREHLRQYEFDQPNLMTPPPDELSAPEFKRFSDLQPRTVTPSDLDYGHIGAFKLGSLRITNGTVSPSPSGPEPLYLDDDFQTQSIVNDAKPTSSDLPPTGVEPTGKLYNEGTGTFVSVKPSQVRFEFHEVSEVPPKIVETMVDIPTFSLGLTDFLPSGSPRQSSSFQSPATAYEMAKAYMQEISASPFSFEESLPSSPQLEATSKPTEIEDNLFDDEPSSAVFLTPPLPANAHWQHSQWPTETQVSSDSLVAPAVKPGSTLQNLQIILSGHREQPPKPLEKADSGYSSKTSLRSLKSHRSFTEIELSTEFANIPVLAPVVPPVPDKSPPPTPPKNVYTKHSNEKSSASSTVQGSKSPEMEYIPATPRKDFSTRSSYGLGEIWGTPQTPNQMELPSNDAPQRPHRQAPPVPQKHPESTWSGWAKRPPLPIKSIEQTQALAKFSSETLSTPDKPTPNKPTPTRRQSTPLLPYGQTMRPGLKQSASDTSISTSSRRLQKRGPIVQPGVVVQGFTEIEPTRVPPVSQEVSEHLEERLRSFPTLTHTYRSVHRTNSKETLATIFSVASAEQQAEEVQLLSRFQGLIPNAPSSKEIDRSLGTESARSSQANGQRFSLMPRILRRSVERQSRRQSLETMTRNRSSSRDAEDQGIYIADLGTASASLGSSPYDLASPALSTISSKRLHESPSVAKHERDTGRGRTVGMNSQSAAQLARERSRSRENERRRTLRRQSSEGRNSSEEQLYLPFDVRSKFATDFGPPVPNIAHGLIGDYALPKKAKSPPPVSMRMSRKRTSSPLPKPSRQAPTTPTNIPCLPETSNSQIRGHVKEQRQDSKWQSQENMWHDRKQSAREALSNARQSINSSQTRNGRPSLERQCQWSSLPTGKRPSFEQRNHSSQPVQQLRSHSSFQQQRGLSHQSYDPSQPRRDGRTLARASFDFSTGGNPRNTHSLSESRSYTQMRSEPLTADRFNGGFTYAY